MLLGEIIIPLEIPSQNVTNQSFNWRVKAAQTKTRRHMWHMFCASEMLMKQIPKATGPRSIDIMAYRARRCADIANLIGGAKACIDGLVDAGLLIDDKDTMAIITYKQDVVSHSPIHRVCTVITVSNIVLDFGS